jgi:hypothetical protein
MNQNTLVNGTFYIRGAVQPNIGGQLFLEGFSGGVPVFGISLVGAISVTTTLASNTLTRSSQSTMYSNNYSGGGTVTYTLPSPDTSQRLTISNSDGAANPLLIQAPAGASIRWPDGTLHDSILSSGNGVDNIALVGESDGVWRVTYAGEAGQSTCTPQ